MPRLRYLDGTICNQLILLRANLSFRLTQTMSKQAFLIVRIDFQKDFVVDPYTTGVGHFPVINADSEVDRVTWEEKSTI